ncbi:hypothetical protein C6361_34160 [Plantactinospora sp. BC1]|uniref:hypothetical protein n=1 Tax=Plantactinospora sp. BC1 TaxID=2108470 RepID=UPI000D170135|nr:hypothetical protein [Plantactinospora sp. BC1]AVT33657.1 hypothetical protein C6361_34160 [Plantactinospora sp. BC1]
MRPSIRTTALLTAALGTILLSTAGMPAEPARAAARVCAVDLRHTGGQDHCPAASAEVVIEILYEDPDFEGPALFITAPHGCTASTADVDHAMPFVGSPGWPQYLGSYRTFAGCTATHYELPNYQGRTFEDGNGPVPFPVGSIRWT